MKKLMVTCLGLCAIGVITTAAAWGPGSIVITNNTADVVNVTWDTSGTGSSELFKQFQTTLPKIVAGHSSAETSFSVNSDAAATEKFKQENDDIFATVDFNGGSCVFQFGNNQQGNNAASFTNNFTKDTQTMIHIKDGQSAGHCKATLTDDNKIVFTID